MTSGNDSPTDWDAYLPHLDGVLNEYFVARWFGTYVDPTVWEVQLRQVEEIRRQGKEYLAVGHGGRYDAGRMRFALASYLLVSGDKTTFRYADAAGANYFQLWRYPEYDARLGAPTGVRYQSGGLWRRDFACGYVTVNVAGRTGTIVTESARPGCS